MKGLGKEKKVDVYFFSNTEKGLFFLKRNIFLFRIFFLSEVF